MKDLGCFPSGLGQICHFLSCKPIDHGQINANRMGVSLDPDQIPIDKGLELRDISLDSFHPPGLSRQAESHSLQPIRFNVHPLRDFP